MFAILVQILKFLAPLAQVCTAGLYCHGVTSPLSVHEPFIQTSPLSLMIDFNQISQGYPFGESLSDSFKTF